MTLAETQSTNFTYVGYDSSKMLQIINFQKDDIVFIMENDGTYYVGFLREVGGTEYKILVFAPTEEAPVDTVIVGMHFQHLSDAVDYCIELTELAKFILEPMRAKRLEAQLALEGNGQPIFLYKLILP